MGRAPGASSRGSKKPGSQPQGGRPSGTEQWGRDAADAFVDFDGDDGNAGGDESDGPAEKEVFDDEWDDWQGASGGATKNAGGFKDALTKASNTSKRHAEYDVDDVDPEDRGKGATSGWTDFYGGEEAGGDSTSGGSDEEFDFKEATRLETERANRLGGLAAGDPLALLLAGAEEDTKTKKGAASKGQEGEEPSAAAGQASRVNAKFQDAFEAEAEAESTPRKGRDLSQLSDKKRQALVKQEAPELVPLLEDFQAKAASLKELLPLLRAKAKMQLPATGRKYVEAKVGLHLNTLANLAYYALLRAEGAEVRAHPVVSQLVWLKELQDKIAPLDSKLQKKLKKSLKAAKNLNEEDRAPVSSAANDEDDLPEPAAAEDGPGAVRRQKLTLRDRLEKIKASMAAPGNSGGPQAFPEAMGNDTRTRDLLSLPGKKRTGAGKVGKPSDLDEFDPLLGSWDPNQGVSQQICRMQQQNRGREARKANPSADVDVEARPRQVRNRASEQPFDAEAEEPRRRTRDDVVTDMFDGEGIGEEDGGDLLREAGAKWKNKKEGKAARKDAAEKAEVEAKVEAQFHPEDVIDGRRKGTKKILKNRGLTRARKKVAGNARVNNRGKYEKRLKRRKGAVQEMRQGASDGTYEGEATGVRTHLAKSRRLDKHNGYSLV